jgi:hypothetical protein
MLRAWFLAVLLAMGLSTAAYAQSASQLVGTYTYTGTDTDGSKYPEPGTVTIKAAPSGAFEVSWDDGEYLGVGQVTGNLFVVASVAEKRLTLSLMTINPDGTLSGPWWRRTDKGSGGSEVWTKKK